MKIEKPYYRRCDFDRSVLNARLHSVPTSQRICDDMVFVL